MEAAGIVTFLLEISGVSKRYGGVSALADCDLTVREGEITGLIGPNGAGKTTLLNVIGGTVVPDAGLVMFDGKNITELPPHERAIRGLVRTFQIARELGSLTVLENVMLAGSARNAERLWPALFGRRGIAGIEARVAHDALRVLERAGLGHMSDHLASDLSGGQKKLLELARALMLKPRLVLLDEPAAGVAPPLVRSLIAFIRELATEGVTFVVVEHDMGLISELCHNVQVLAEGRQLVSGTFAEVAADRRVLDAYLGRAA